MPYSIFIDETGNHSPAATNEPQRRFLSITGIILKTDYHDGVFSERFDNLRIVHFGHKNSKPVHLHRRKLIRAEGDFAVLRDQRRQLAWGADFLGFLGHSEFTTITTCIDKIAFYHRYPNWTDDPYHLCFFNALERFFYFLRNMNSTGTVFVERRNPGRDKKLEKAYQSFWENGSPPHIGALEIQRHILSPNLAIVSKDDDIPGIQLADLTAKPSFSYCRYIYTKIDEFTPFANRVAYILWKGKYYSYNKRVDGYGRVWRPRLR